MKKRLLLTFILFSLIIVSLPITATAANYKKAYKEEVNRFEKEKGGSEKECSYSLIYVDKDKTPELVCESKYMKDGSTVKSYFEFYTFRSGKIKSFSSCVYARVGMYSDRPFYRPKKNLFGIRHWHMASQDDDIYALKKGELVLIRTKEYDKASFYFFPLISKCEWIYGEYSKKGILKRLKKLS